MTRDCAIHWLQALSFDGIMKQENKLKLTTLLFCLSAVAAVGSNSATTQTASNEDVSNIDKDQVAASVGRLVLVAAESTVDTVISEVILREAYARLGIKIDILKVPAERALRMANRGDVAGDAQRIDGLSETYPNLIKVSPPINFISGTAFSKTASFSIDGWDSLRPYRIGIIRGIKFAEQNTVGMDRHLVGNYESLLKMLDRGRIDVMVSPYLNGLFQIRQLGANSEGVSALEPPISHIDLFHYLHVRHELLVERISNVLETMRATGELAAIRQHVVEVLLDRAEHQLPICDGDYACFK